MSKRESASFAGRYNDIVRRVGGPDATWRHHGKKGAGTFKTVHHKEPCRWCGQLIGVPNGSLKRHEAVCRNNPANAVKPEVYHCRECGVGVPRGATACIEHEWRDARMIELDRLTAHMKGAA